jgi:hypothetical protein
VKKLSLIRRAAVAAVIAVPVGLAAPAVLNVGASAAHATDCVDIGTNAGSTSNEILGIAATANPVVGIHGTQCNQGTDTSTAAINVCAGAADTEHDSTGQPDVVDVSQGPVAGAGIDAFAYFENGSVQSPAGEFEAYAAGVEAGIASEQTGC